MKNKVKAFFVILWQGITKPVFTFLVVMTAISGIPIAIFKGAECLFNFWFPGKGIDIVGGLLIAIMALFLIIVCVGAFIEYIRDDLIPAYHDALNYFKYKEKNKNEK